MLIDVPHHIRELDRRAVRASTALVTGTAADQLTRPTPCADWTLGDLLAHMSAQHRGFAAATRGQGGDPASWTLPPVRTDPARDYLEASERVLAAFAEVDLQKQVELADFGGASFPVEQAMAFHFLDYLVHAWDVAEALGKAFTPESDLVEACWRIAAVIPTDADSRPAGGPFGPVAPTPEDASSFERLLAHVGRTPRRPARPE